MSPRAIGWVVTRTLWNTCICTGTWMLQPGAPGQLTATATRDGMPWRIGRRVCKACGQAAKCRRGLSRVGTMTTRLPAVPYCARTACSAAVRRSSAVVSAWAALANARNDATANVAKIRSLPCLQGRVGVGCERSEPWEADVVVMRIWERFCCVLKHKQPHPNPPLLPQGRGLIAPGWEFSRQPTRFARARQTFMHPRQPESSPTGY